MNVRSTAARVLTWTRWRPYQVDHPEEQGRRAVMGPTTKDNVPTSVRAQRKMQNAPDRTQPLVVNARWSEAKKRKPTGLRCKRCLATMSGVAWTQWLGRPSVTAATKIAHAQLASSNILNLTRLEGAPLPASVAFTESISATARLLTSYKQQCQLKTLVVSHGR